MLRTHTFLEKSRVIPCSVVLRDTKHEIGRKNKNIQPGFEKNYSHKKKCITLTGQFSGGRPTVNHF